MASLLRNISSRFSTSTNPNNFQKAAEATDLFLKTDPIIDGEDCLHDCETCTIKYPRKFKVEESLKLYGHIKGWSTHLIVATGKADWVRNVEDEKGSVMEAIEKCKTRPENGRMMLSASNMPIPTPAHSNENNTVKTRVLLLPAFKYIDNVTPSSIPDLIQICIDPAPTNTSPLPDRPLQMTISDTLSHRLTMHNCPHKYLILLCSHSTRDARCGQSAPLLRKEFERHLRPLGLYRDLEDERPGGVGIYFTNHVGGHKFSANVLIYRRSGGAAKEIDGEDDTKGSQGMNGSVAEESSEEAAQCIWMARVKPAEVENIVRYTLLQGKLVDPKRQLRGGFDRVRGLTSW